MPRRVRPRLWLLLPGTLLAAVLLLGGGLYVRGTWADTEPRLPGHVGDEPVCHVFQPPGEEPCVRCAVLLPYPIEQVWDVIIDADRFGDICPYIQSAEVQHDPDHKSQIDARVQTAGPFSVPFGIEVRNQRELERFVSRWDRTGGDVLVNRGAWVLTPRGPDETLLELTMEVRMRAYPTFFLRNYSLQRLPQVVQAVQRRLASGGPGKPW
jgi:uncharacterized membrane protein